MAIELEIIDRAAALMERRRQQTVTDLARIWGVKGEVYPTPSDGDDVPMLTMTETDRRSRG